MTDPATDLTRVRELLGREPRGEFAVVVRDDDGDPVVIRNAPLLDDGTPMPTRYWLVSPIEGRRIGQLEARGGVDAAEAAVDPDELRAAHDRYAAERDEAVPDDHTGPRPSGGVGGTRVGVKCLHAHWAWHLAGGDDPVGRWIAAQLATVTVDVGNDVVTFRHADGDHETPCGVRRLTERWLTEHDPPRPDALTNALGTVDDHLADLVRLHPRVADITTWVFSGATIDSLAALEAGHQLTPGEHTYSRSDAEEVFRVVATEAADDRAANPGLAAEHVDVIVATSVVVQAVMRRFLLPEVTLLVTGG